MPQFLEQYGTEAQCEAALQAARWPHGFVCPRCRGSARTTFVRAGLRYWQCAHCAHQCSLLSSTMFAASKLIPTIRTSALLDLNRPLGDKINSCPTDQARFSHRGGPWHAANQGSSRPLSPA